VNILIVEDEKNLGLTLCEYLSSMGHNVNWCNNAKNTYLSLNIKTPDLIFMDVMLPDGNGIEIAKKVDKTKTKIIFLSALNDPETRVEGLESGGMEYITKPFSLKEIKIRLQRIEEKLPLVYKIAGHEIDFDQFIIRNNKGSEKKINTKEKSILELLLNNEGTVISRETIIRKVWGEDQFPSNRTVDNYIVNLRKIFEVLDIHELTIESIRSIGYKIIKIKERK